MSPEQVRGEVVGVRSDVFSFGAVLFEMLTGKRAFSRDTAADTLVAILKEDPPDIEDSGKPLPPALRRILDHCLDKVPARRFHDAHDLAFALENALGSSSGSVLAPALPADATRLKRLAISVAVIAMACALGLLAGRLWRERPAPMPTFTPLTLDGEVIRAARFTRGGQSVIFSTQSNDVVEKNIRKVDLGSPIVHNLLGPDAWPRSTRGSTWWRG
jgi:serine/threonine protein kinase